MLNNRLEFDDARLAVNTITLFTCLQCKIFFELKTFYS